MKILISVSASPTWAKGQRVLVKLDKNEWYLATVKSVRTSGVQCVADDGEPVKFDVDSTARDVKLLEAGAPIRKRSLTDAQVKDLVLKDKESVKKQKAKEKAKADASKAVSGRRTSVKPQMRVPRSTVDTQKPNVHVAPTSRTSCPTFNVSYSSSPKAMLDYLNKLWLWANEEHFDNRLPKPYEIRLQRDTDVKRMRRRAAWFPTKRVISVHPRLFNAPEAKVHEIFVHEMCHQAVTDIDHVRDNSDGGHGPNWRSWMIKCGLNPNRFDAHGNDTYMDEDEKEAYQKRQERKEEDTQKIKETTDRKFFWRGKPEAVCYSAGQGIVYGLAAWPSDQKQTRIAVVTNPYSNQFMKIPTEWLHVVPETDANYVRVTGQSFVEAAERIRKHFDTKAAVRTMKRTMRLYM